MVLKSSEFMISNIWTHSSLNLPSKNKSLRVLASWEINPGYMPPFKFSSNQINVCRSQKQKINLFDYNSGGVQYWTPDGDYDLYDFICSKGIDPNFDLIVIWSSSAKSGRGFYNRPINLHKFYGKKLLILGDTHHMDEPIGSMMEYANKEQFTHVTTMYDRHHLHYFERIQNSPKLGWFPMASLQHRSAGNIIAKNPAISLLGNLGSAHRYRQKIISAINSSKFDAIVGVRKNVDAFTTYQNCLININTSLNGDFNLRTHEVIMAGGFLLTDALSAESGFQQIFQVGTHCDIYSSPFELLEKIEHYLSRPKLTSQIAVEGLNHYLRHLHPKITIQKIVDWIFQDRLELPHDVSRDWRHQLEKGALKNLPLVDRSVLYERVQELGRLKSPAHIFIGNSLNELHLVDLIDLVRVKIYIDPADLVKVNLIKDLGLQNRIIYAKKDDQRWDLVFS